MHLNQPYQPRLCVCNSKESLAHNEASKANLDAYKRIILNAAIFRIGLQSYRKQSKLISEGWKQKKQTEEGKKERKEKGTNRKEQKKIEKNRIK